ncbi:MAG: outer membrane lipoprotein carrier protein LolA, partial [Myxococcales bacterium]|nr:outer membrane lipoprotein carrier protein LolA [Myxococcales bacterium]
LFYVMKKDGRTTGVVRRVLIVDAAGNRNRFDFFDFEWDPKVSADRFRFSPPPGTRRVKP